MERASELSEQKNKDGKPLDNGDIMSQILALREQKAQLLGFTNFAELSLSKKMADNVDTVETFLLEFADKATPCSSGLKTTARHGNDTWHGHCPSVGYRLFG